MNKDLKEFIYFFDKELNKQIKELEQELKEKDGFKSLITVGSLGALVKVKNALVNTYKRIENKKEYLNND